MTFNYIRIHYILRLVLFWLFFFAFFRVLFIVYHHAKIPDGQHSETGLAFLYALRLDLSAACMAAVIPYLLWTVQQFNKNRLIHRINLAVNIVLISTVAILSVANIKLYGEWGTLLSARALNYLMYPKEVLTFISFWSVVLLLMGCSVFAYFGIRIYKQFLTNFSYPLEKKKWKWALAVIIPFLLLLGYRGGFQLSPINESSAYYSNLQINNHIATNNMWYLAHSILDANDKKNPYMFMEPERVMKMQAELFPPPSGKTQKIFKTSSPNIVVIVLESWTADIIKSMGGEKNVTPHFEELRKEGLLFTQMYSSGFRTDQGIVSILSGYPAQPNNSIITTPSKSEKLPSLNMQLGSKGYQSSFYYGGEIEFANMKSYLLETQFGRIIDKNDFKGEELNSKWGAHDEYVFKKQLHDLSKEKTPFFSVILTLSTHEPFEVTMQTPFIGGEEHERFKKAAYYTDYCLFNYFNEAKKQPWYNNTVFILVADHGHRLPKGRDMNMPEGRHITAMITGGALVDSLRGKTMDRICNHNDWPAIVLSQLGMSYEKFNWSKDPMNPSSKEFAYYSNENTLGWISPAQKIVYTFTTKKIDGSFSQPESADSTLNYAKAYLQSLYQSYLDY